MSVVFQTLLEISTILKNSPRIISFCSENDLNSITVNYPADEQNPLGTSEAPWIVLDPEGGDGGLEVNSTDFSIGLDVGVVGESESGSKMADELFTLALDVLVKAGLEISRVHFEYWLSYSDPLRMVFSTIEISKSRSLGRSEII